ncbi:MAG: transcription antitermination factor NusB [Chitinophagales bacterium]
MLSRRNVRIKVMQTVYAHTHDPEKTVERLEKTMLENINSFYRAFLYNLYILSKTTEFVIQDVQIRAGKHIPSAEDNFLSVQLFHNFIIQHFVETEEIYKEMRREKLDNRIEEDYFRQFFQALKKTPEYYAYSHLENPLLPDDKEIISFLYKKILYPNETFQQHIEDIFPGWLDDKDAIYHSVMNTITALSPAQKSFVVRDSKETKEEKQFAIQLLRSTLHHETELDELIAPFLENWDKERLAMMDFILMKMAVSEMLYLPEIPLKVTMNEYIDLAKLYSTPKSGEFINGILDAIMKKLKEDGKILKEGRGVKED